MLIQKIGAKIISPIRKLHKMRLDKKLAKMEANMAEVERLHDEFLLKDDPKLLEKREAVKNLVDKGPLFKAANKSGFQPNFGLLASEKSEILIDRCGDDVEQIKALYGNYGLAQYAHLSPSKLLDKSNSKIFDYGYEEGKSIRYAFDEFLLNNESGSLTDIEQRFGQAGDVLYNHCSKLGFVKTGFNSYKLSPFGKDQLGIHHSMERLEPTLDSILNTLQ